MSVIARVPARIHAAHQRGRQFFLPCRSRFFPNSVLLPSSSSSSLFQPTSHYLRSGRTNTLHLLGCYALCNKTLLPQELVSQNEPQHHPKAHFPPPKKKKKFWNQYKQSPGFCQDFA